VLPAQLVSAAPCCLALPHPATAHRALLSPGPTCQPPRARRPRPTALHCHAAAPPPAPASRGPTPAARAIPLPHQSLLFFPVPTLHTAPTPGPPASHFSLLPRARARSKGVSHRPLSSPLRSFTPMLKHTATSPVLLKIGSLTSNARASLLPP
jgi:hypothetical protein